MAALGLLSGLGVGLWVVFTDPRREPLLNANVPGVSSPAFRADGGSALVAEDLAFHEGFGDRTAVD